MIINKMATAAPEFSITQQPPTIEQLNELRQEGWATDVDIAAKDGEVVKAHRVVLGAACPALKQQLEDEQKLDLSRFPKR